MAVIVGIDLGTTYSAIAVIDESGHPRIVHNKDGQNITPSCVTESEGKVEVGEYARKTWGVSPEMAAARFKRHMGTNQKFKINGHDYSATELSALVLKKLVKDAEAEIGKIDEAVVTIPANFAHEAREATMAAAKAAGLNVKYIINEPTAAAIYYAFKNGTDLRGNYAVYDIGGGTFDISIIRAIGQNVEVLATNGVSKLGGDDFDNALISLVRKKYKQTAQEELPSDHFTKNHAEEEKKVLSNRSKTKFRVGNHQIEVTRDEFEESISSFVAQAEMLCESTLEEAHLKPSEITGIFLVGGSSRIPIVKESVARVFKKNPESTINVDEVVALGAALYAAYKGTRTNLTPIQSKSIEKMKVEESTSKCFGTISLSQDQTRGQTKRANNVLIRKGDKIPCSVTRSFYTIHDDQKSVNCNVTESTSPETDPAFVKTIWEGSLVLPPGRPKDQEIKVTFSYDENQIMKCTFVDVGTGRETKVDLSMTASANLDGEKIKRFMVE